MIRLSSLHCGGGTEPWRNLGLDALGDTVVLADVELVTHGGSPGLTAWSFVVDEALDSIVEGEGLSLDGISTDVSRGAVAPTRVRSPIGRHEVVGLDHVVVMTDDMERTCSRIESVLGLELRRERDLGNGVRQCFYKPDNTVLEVVTNTRGKTEATSGASLWGLVLSIDDLAGLCADLGPDVASAPRPATQPGRHISTVRPAVGLGVQVALMSPHVTKS